MGDLNYFLRIRVGYQSNDSLHLTQAKYIQDLPSKTNMFETKLIYLSMVKGFKLIKDDYATLSYSSF